MLIIAFATVYVVWGSTYFFIKMAVDGFPPLLLGALRFLTAGFLLLTWCKIKGEQIFIKRNITHAAVTGFLLLVIGTGTVIWVEQTLPSAMVAIMVSSAPIWFVLFDKQNWRVNFKSTSTIVGLIIGFAGVVLLFSKQILGLFDSSTELSKLPGMLLILIGAMSWASGSLYSKYNNTQGSASVNTGFTVTALTVIYLKEAGYLPWVTKNHLHTLGVLIFAFSIFWTYLWFEQFLLMYYSNLPEEAVYFYKRWEPEFQFWFWLNLAINFCAPFFALMSRDSKLKVSVMKVTCILLVLGHWLDYWQMIMPGTTGPQANWYTEIGFIEAATFIVFVGLFCYMVLHSLSKLKALAPKNHPFLEESLHHQN